MAENNIDIETLRALLRYDPDTGKLFWKERPEGQRRWNTRYAGKEAFTALTSEGYRAGVIYRRKYNAHRVIWALHYGAWPTKEIDHVDRDRANNRISNLRDVSHAENMRNQPLRADNTTGHTGVILTKSGKYQVQIRAGGVDLRLGHFVRLEDAIAARRAAEAEHNFHPNHGRAA